VAAISSVGERSRGIHACRHAVRVLFLFFVRYGSLLLTVAYVPCFGRFLTCVVWLVGDSGFNYVAAKGPVEQGTVR